MECWRSKKNRSEKYEEKAEKKYFYGPTTKRKKQKAKLVNLKVKLLFDIIKILVSDPW